jgi:hypothetical protein
MSCAHVSVEPVEVKPIHIIADVNLNVKIDHELDNFFAFEKNYQPPATQAAATLPGQAAPTTAPAAQ